MEEMTQFELAEWLHDSYEESAKIIGWDTQEKCKVPFDELPNMNKLVMLEMAHKLKQKFDI